MHFFPVFFSCRNSCILCFEKKKNATAPNSIRVAILTFRSCSRQEKSIHRIQSNCNLIHLNLVPDRPWLFASCAFDVWLKFCTEQNPAEWSGHGSWLNGPVRSWISRFFFDRIDNRSVNIANRSSIIDQQILLNELRSSSNKTRQTIFDHRPSISKTCQPHYWRDFFFCCLCSNALVQGQQLVLSPIWIFEYFWGQCTCG